MQKLFAAIGLSFYLLLGFYPDANENANGNAASAVTAATCNGYTPCNACSNCSKCKYCSNGGTCGKCEKKESTYKSKAPAPVSTQCKAITKKGTQCTRKAGDNGYCWQHAG
jgi:hypothetical protein